MGFYANEVGGRESKEGGGSERAKCSCSVGDSIGAWERLSCAGRRDPEP